MILTLKLHTKKLIQIHYSLFSAVSRGVGIALDLFESYLKNRKHYTVVHGVSSGMKNITCGVPQGSTLGSLLCI